MKAYKNTDKELWREPNDKGETDDVYQPSIHVTQNNMIGIDVGGSVYVKSLRDWHDLAGGKLTLKDFEIDILLSELENLDGDEVLDRAMKIRNK